ncbi:MAG: HEAT repeat domain-containing protein [Candidatus Glassbacteria bacterium]|nr:HEAT repeat domain-containing protein [Candidatus Glassbacteria bacterium]
MREAPKILHILSGKRVFALAALPGILSAMLLISGCGGGEKADPVLEGEKVMVTEGVQILHTGTSVQRDSVIRTFNNLNNPRLLHPYIHNADLSVRIGIVSALGNLKDRGAVDSLNRMLVTSDDYLLRETVIWALGELGDTSSVPVLIGIIQDTTQNRDLRLGLPITLASFINTAYAGRVEQTFVDVLQNMSDDLELCSYVAVGILEVLKPGNYELFHARLPLLKELAAKRMQESGEDGIYINFQLTIEELETYEPGTL